MGWATDDTDFTDGTNFAKNAEFFEMALQENRSWAQALRRLIVLRAGIGNDRVSRGDNSIPWHCDCD
jgi:hypothetical protein